ncbi:MAG: Inosose isomerase [Planctomycetes bacterium ADurb.Bin126]|nr:MAG: Inosose isomerase [Planctomycetes bacterium ADurb.Bin126]HOD80674.1 sugar phosphate isomerase/epimerase family protein [Phycisphaerae bacterium]
MNLDCRTDRRGMLAWAGGAAVAGAAAWQACAQPARGADRPKDEPFGYCLNMGTVMGHKLTLDREIELAARAGYNGIEPWTRSIKAYVEGGGSAKDLAKRAADAGLSVEGAIGFFDWIVDEPDRRAKALEQARQEMELVASIGGRRIAAPPAGATNEKVDLLAAAERYAALVDIGRQVGVVPAAEIWGRSQTMGRLGEAALVAIHCGRKEACILPDVFHMYRGGSAFEGLRLLSAQAIAVFHVNDYPADPPREQSTDAHRVMPGDGVAPLGQIFRDLAAIGYRGMISLELFNRDYWKMEPLQVARIGLEKMRSAVRKALA